MSSGMREVSVVATKRHFNRMRFMCRRIALPASGGYQPSLPTEISFRLAAKTGRQVACAPPELGAEATTIEGEDHVQGIERIHVETHLSLAAIPRRQCVNGDQEWSPYKSWCGRLMSPVNATTRGILLRKTQKLSDTSLIVLVHQFARDIQTVARGARRPRVLFADSSICSLKPSYQSRKAANRICIPCVRLWWSMHSQEFELIMAHATGRVVFCRVDRSLHRDRASRTGNLSFARARFRLPRSV